MKKSLKLLSVLLALALLLAMPAYASGLGNFVDRRPYTDGQFTDVRSDDWFAPYVAKAYRLGIIDGMTDSTFVPQGNLTYAEAVKLAAVLNEIYYDGSVTLSNGADVWYSTYAMRCLEMGVIATDFPDYNANISRSDFAAIFAACLPPDALAPVNPVASASIPDVNPGDANADAILLLYRAGVLTGVDDAHSFHPASDITRAEVCAIVARMADPSLRLRFSLGPGEPKVTSVYVSDLASGAIFVTVSAADADYLYYSFDGPATPDSPEVAAGASIPLGADAGSTLSLLAAGSDGPPVRIDLAPMVASVTALAEKEQGFYDLGERIRADMALIQPFVASGDIAAGENQAALDANEDLKEAAAQLNASGVPVYLRAADAAMLASRLMESLVTRTADYAQATGLALWNASVADYARALLHCQETAPGRMVVYF
ncbi:MAG: S-layer homology domain-containing protein [Firmicutes bacterium]|nr:S-layer homology domain-containing protein [Bacillota bacterium]